MSSSRPCTSPPARASSAARTRASSLDPVGGQVRQAAADVVQEGCDRLGPAGRGELRDRSRRREALRSRWLLGSEPMTRCSTRWVTPPEAKSSSRRPTAKHRPADSGPAPAARTRGHRRPHPAGPPRRAPCPRPRRSSSSSRAGVTGRGRRRRGAGTEAGWRRLARLRTTPRLPARTSSWTHLTRQGASGTPRTRARSPCSSSRSAGRTVRPAATWWKAAVIRSRGTPVSWCQASR